MGGWVLGFVRHVFVGHAPIGNGCACIGVVAVHFDEEKRVRRGQKREGMKTRRDENATTPRAVAARVTPLITTELETLITNIY